MLICRSIGLAGRACRSLVWVVHSPLDIMIEVSLVDQVLDLILQVPAFFGVVVIFTVETIVSALVPFLGSGLDANELVKSDDKVSRSCGACSILRCGAVDFSGTIDGVSDWVSGGFSSVGPGRAGAGCS
ncbi:hypothetical protein GW17_00028313 [Ensete ventricosum]|nr:hypothetical protein GW17_00028313 [Ensete ventricosum]